jgi:hypothetical protein
LTDANAWIDGRISATLTHCAVVSTLLYHAQPLVAKAENKVGFENIATQWLLTGDKTLAEVQGCDSPRIGRLVLGTSGRSSLHNRVSTCLA